MRRLRALTGICTAAIAAVVMAPAAADARTETFRLRSQPFMLSGFKTSFPKVTVATPPGSGYITGMNAWSVDERGRRASMRDVTLHHLVFINKGAPGGPVKRGSCPGRGGEPFWGTGEEKQPLILPRDYGYKIAAGERWRADHDDAGHHGAPLRQRCRESCRGRG